MRQRFISQNVCAKDIISSLKVKIVKNIKLGVGFTVFVIFFSIAFIEAFQKNNWLEGLLFIALGIVSIWADSRKK
jgi:hypothetical protein